MKATVQALVFLLPALGCAAARPAAEGPGPAAPGMSGPVAPVPPPPRSALAADVEDYLARVPDVPVAARLSAAAAVDETPPVRVVAKRVHDDEPVGPYGQPGWTTHRRFATTRAYVLPPGQIEMEAWWRGTWKEDSAPAHRLQGELGVGLPYRLQLDFYQNFEDPPGGEAVWAGSQVEIRWALADWDEIFWNPTIYGEWKFIADGPDVYELKLLLSDDIAPRWRGAANLTYEAQDSGDEETEIALAIAASYTVRDDKFYVGAEMVVNRVTEGGPDGAPDVEVLLGPSFQWRPTPRTHVDVVPLFGLTEDAPDVRIFVVFGIELGGGGDEHGYAPTSLKSE